ncbi:hypothetical protein [Nocardia aurea]|uniref:hypothetical protein n=1 Tax=Nocardia aurea TaxID=2144174 RepID=UPI0033AC5366
MSRLHLPHPHIAERVAEAFTHGLLDRLCHRQPPIVPDGHDWPEWHHYDGEENQR